MGTFTVFFDDPFWVGIATRDDEVARVVFGSEPTDAQLVEWAKSEYGRLAFTKALASVPTKLSGNPKRRQREARAALETPKLRTAAQETWAAALSASKAEHARERATKRREEADARFAERQAKKKAKRRGR